MAKWRTELKETLVKQIQDIPGLPGIKGVHLVNKRAFWMNFNDYLKPEQVAVVKSLYFSIYLRPYSDTSDYLFTYEGDK